MEWKNELSSEQLLLPFEGLLDGANRLCDQYAIGLSRIGISALPDQYERAYAASLGGGRTETSGKSRTPGPSELTDILQK
jgi:hypothetical protein